MADSTIAITAGTGTAVDTRTESTNGHHRQVVVLGDPATNAGVAPVDATAGLKVDLGADNDITGTVTANLSATDNAVLDAIAASVDTLDSVDFATQTTLAEIKAKTDNIPALGQALSAASVPVVLPAAQITTLTPPAAITGFATSAKQDTIIGHVDGVETSLSSIDGKITAVNTGAVVVSSSALPTGAATAAKQDDIITAIGAIPGGGGTQYTEGDTDATITGTAALVEGAANALNVMTQPLTDTQLRAADVKITLDGETVPVTGTFWQATQPVSGTVTANLSATDNAVLDDIASDTEAIKTSLAGTLTVTGGGGGVEYTEGDTDASITGSAILWEDTGDTLRAVSAAKPLPISDAGGTLTVDGTVGVSGTVAVTQSGTWDEVGINDSGNSITVDYATTGSGTATGALRVELPTNGTGVIATVGAVTAITNALPAGTNAIGKLSANSGVDIGDVDVTSVSGTVTTKGIPSDIDINGSNANHADKYYTNAGAVTDGIVWSPAAGKRWHVLTLYINVSAAATVTLEDDLAGGDVARWKGELAANSGVVLTYDKEHPFSSGEDAADLIITTSAGNVYVQAVGYEI